MPCVGQHGGMAGDDFDDNPLEPAEQLDSDEVRNDDGDEVVDPPEEWIEARTTKHSTRRLAEEVPDDLGDDEGTKLSDADDSDAGGGLTLVSNDELDHMDPSSTGANAARSTARRRTATRSSTSSSELLSRGPQHHHGAGGHGHLPAGVVGFGVVVGVSRGVDHRNPRGAEFVCGEREVDRLVMGVEPQQE